MTFARLTRKVLMLAAAAALLVTVGCSRGGEDRKITLAYVAWDSEIASTHVVKLVLEEKLGYQVDMMQVDAGPMWAGISDGSADAMVAAWLPTTHQSYYESFEGQFVDLGPNMEGTKIGLVVPAYWDAQSIEDLKKPEYADAVGRQIIGIEPGAGVMMTTEAAMDAYGLTDWTLVESSSAAMASELLKAYQEERPIIVTGWTPHWKFAKMELKYLEDPLGVYGGDERIHTIVRKGLDQDHPDAYQFLDRFYWTPDDMAQVMVDIQEGMEAEEAARKWIEANGDKVDAWVEGLTP
jgi:glycine betaine/proline transport system substrate-binding protein